MEVGGGAKELSFGRIFVPLVAIVFALTSLIAWALIQAEIERVSTDAALAAKEASATLASSLEIAATHARIVGEEREVRRAYEAPDDPEALASMAAAFTSLLARNPHYGQARWIDETGRERLRVARAPDGSVKRIALTHDASSPGFVREGLAAAPGTVHFSRLDRDVDDGARDEQLLTLGALTAVADGDGARRGIIVINTLLGPLLARLADEAEATGLTLMLVNSRGEWLLGPPSGSASSLLERPSVTLAEADPELWSKISEVPSGKCFNTALTAWSPVAPNDAERPADARGGETPWIVLARAEGSAMRGLITGIALPSALVSLVLLLLLGALTRRLVVDREVLVASRDAAAIAAHVKWLVSEIATAANTAANAEEMVHLCLRPLCEATKIGVGVAMFGDELGMHYIAEADDPGAIGEALAALEDSVWLRELRRVTEPQWVVLTDLRTSDTERDAWRLKAHAAGLRGALGIPLVIDGEAIACCVLLYTDLSESERASLAAVIDTAWTSLAAQVGCVLARERSATAMEGARAVAESASRAKSDFVANMSHELRTPLNAIIGYGEILHEELSAEGLTEIRDIADRMNGATRHLLGLINNILDLSKIEAGKMSVTPERVDLRAMLDEIRAVLLPLVEDQGNRLDFECTAPDRPIMVDGTKVRQIIFNLVGNAAKFTKEGTITLHVEVDGDRGRLRILVADTGIGMSEAQLARIFEAFTQAEGDTAKRYGGTGLGLTLSRHLASLLGGSIAVESEVGVGSTFTVEVPVELAEPG